MIKNSNASKYKIKAEDIIVNDINIIDYINNKVNKLQNDITTYANYKFGANINDGTLSLDENYTPILMNTINAWYGSELFKINSDNIEYIGSTPSSNDQTVVKVDFTANMRATNFTAGETVWAEIKILKKDGTTRKNAYVSNTVVDTSSRNELSTFCISTLEEGDKIYFSLAVDNANSINVTKCHFSIDLQQQIPVNYYKFNY